MIWFDTATPKYGVFFKELIPLFSARGHKAFVTTRYSPDYTEAKAVLDHAGISCHVVGQYGGQDRLSKFNSRLKRQSEFLKLFEQYGTPQALITGCVADSAQVAFGLGIPVILLCDTPLAADHFDYKRITVVSKLTIPLATALFHPFVIPSEVFYKLGLAPDQVISHEFIDVYWWMKDLKPLEKDRKNVV